MLGQNKKTQYNIEWDLQKLKTDLNATRAGVILQRSSEREDADETH